MRPKLDSMLKRFEEERAKQASTAKDDAVANFADESEYEEDYFQLGEAENNYYTLDVEDEYTLEQRALHDERVGIHVLDALCHSRATELSHRTERMITLSGMNERPIPNVCGNGASSQSHAGLCL